MPDIVKLKADVSKMIDQGASEAEVDTYVHGHGATPEMLRVDTPASTPAPVPANPASPYPADFTENDKSEAQTGVAGGLYRDIGEAIQAKLKDRQIKAADAGKGLGQRFVDTLGSEWDHHVKNLGGFELDPKTKDFLNPRHATSGPEAEPENIVGTLWKGIGGVMAGVNTGITTLLGSEHDSPGAAVMSGMEAFPEGGLSHFGVPSPPIVRGYSAIFQDMKSKPVDLINYAKENGLEVDPVAVVKAYKARNKPGVRAGDKVEIIQREAPPAETASAPPPTPAPTAEQPEVANLPNEAAVPAPAPDPVAPVTQPVDVNTGVPAGEYPPVSSTDGGTTPPGEPTVGINGNDNAGPGGYEPGYGKNSDENFTGSINRPNLELTPEAEAAMKAAGEEVPVGKKTQGWDETAKNADENPPTVDQHAEDTSFEQLPEKVRAGQKLVQSGWENVLAKASDHGVGSDEYNQALVDAVTASARHSENVGNTARALNILKAPLEGDSPLATSVLRRIQKFAADPANAEALNGLVEKHLGDPEAMAKIARDMQKPKFSDWIKSGAYNAMLSNPASLTRNIVGNVVNLYGDIATQGWGSVVGGVRTGFSSKADRIMSAEVASRLYGSYEGLLQGLKNFSTAYKHASPLDVVMREGGGSPFHSKTAMVLEAATRTMAASDEVARMMAQVSDLRGQATRAAIRSGLKGDALKARVAELIKNPTDEMLSAAGDYARLMRFQDNPGFIAGPVERMLKESPTDAPATRAAKLGLRLTVVPFIRTPSSIIRTAARNSPLGIGSSKNYYDFIAGGARRDMAIARVATGTAVVGLATKLASDGQLTGMGPEDYRKNAELTASGWRPNSVKVGNKYVSYDNLGPISLVLSSTATAYERAKAGEMKGDTYAGNTAAASLGVADAMLNNGWMEGIANFFGAMTGPASQRGSGLTNTAANISTSLTVPAILRAVNTNYIDPVNRETKGDNTFGDRIENRVMSGIPGLSTSLPAKHDAYGDVVQRHTEGGPLSIFNPVLSNDAKTDPQEIELARLSATDNTGKALVNPVPTTIDVGKDKIRLNGEDYQKYQAITGDYVKTRLAEIMKDSGWKTIPDDEKRELIKSLMKEARRNAKDAVINSYGAK